MSSESNKYYIYDGEEYDSLENMLLADMKDGTEFKPSKYLCEIDWTPEKVIEAVRWFGDVEEVCKANLDYETKEYEYDELDKEVS